MPPSRNQMEVGLHCFSEANMSQLQQLGKWLNGRGLDLCELDNSGTNFGIVLLSKEDVVSEIIQRLSQLVSEGYFLIAVDVGETNLPFFRIAELLALGVVDVLPWSYQEQLVDCIYQRRIRYQIVQKVINSNLIKNKILGDSYVWKKVLQEVIEIACFSTKPVLVLGESGTGKELIARLIHDLDRRPEKEGLTLLDCSTLVPDLSGSEFFGHEKGAYTNAVSSREGAFAQANNGTLFLDEIGELPLNLQAALLRVIQEGTYKKLGSNDWKRTNFRLVSATNRPLRKVIEKNQFRGDLYFRISTCIVRLPTLRARLQDIPTLANHFLAQELNVKEPPQIDKLLLHHLMTRDYPGNVRELRQLISRIAYRYTGVGPITLGCLPIDHQVETMGLHPVPEEQSMTEAIRQALANGLGLKEIKRIAGNIAMDIAIDEAEGNLQSAAKRLDVSDRTLQVYRASI